MSAAHFVPGQLVEPDASMLAIGEKLPLFNVPGGVERVLGESVNTIGWLCLGDVAIIVAREKTKAGDVYVLGAHGGGWASSAFLRILVSPIRKT